MPFAYILRYGWVWQRSGEQFALLLVPPLMVALLVWSLMSSWVRLDGFRAGWMFSAVVSQLLLAVAALMSSLFAAAFLLRHYVSRLTLGYYGLLLFVGFVVIRVIARSILISRYTRGLVRNVAIVGNGPLSHEMATKIERHPEMLRRVVGFLTPGESAWEAIPSGSRGDAVRLRTADIVQLLKARRIDEVILTVPTPGHPEILDLSERCGRDGIAVSLVPQPYELYLSKPELIDLDGLPLLQLQTVTRSEGDPVWKRAFDVAMTLVLLPACLPLMLAGAGLLKLRKSRAFSCEQRCGYHGEVFGMYRLDSPRRAIGLPGYESILQNLSVTELPQLINVLRGEMSLVGPRPEGLDRARRYTDWHRQRLTVKPGITGLAQVHGLRDQHSSEDKTRYDLQYILRRSLFQDISLLMQTAWILAARIVRVRVLESPQGALAEKDVNIDFQENLAHAHSSQSSAD